MKKGAGVLLTIGILLVLFIFIFSLLVIFRAWDKISFKISAGKQAWRYAKAGLETGIWEIDHDSREYDSYFDDWRKNFAGAEVDNDQDGNPDSAWINICDRNGRLMGRFAVLIEDENSKINVNAAGNLSGGFNEGYTPAEVDILGSFLGKSLVLKIVGFRYGRDALPGQASQDDDGDAGVLAGDKVDNDGDGWVDEYGEGTDEPDEFRPEKPLGDDRPYLIPEDLKLIEGLGSVHFNLVRNLVTASSYDRNTNRANQERLNLDRADFESLRQLLLRLGYQSRLADQVAVNIMDFRDADNVPTILEADDKKIIGLENTAYLNEIDAVLPWEVKHVSAGILFLEKGSHFLELFNPYPVPVDISGWKITGIINLFSSLWHEVFDDSQSIYDDAVAGETVLDQGKAKRIQELLIPTSIAIPGKTTIAPHSYYTIGDTIRIAILVPQEGPPILLVFPYTGPKDCQQYEPILAITPSGSERISEFLSRIPLIANLGLDFTIRLYDRDNHLIEEARYPLDTPWTTVQKNDPRMRGTFDWFTAPASPGQQNVIFQPWIGGEFGQVGWLELWKSSFYIKNGAFSSPADLSFIHRMEHWKTLDFWKEGKDRVLLDHCTVVDDPGRPTWGRLNINTASETALMCLPLVDRGLAEAIIAGRPFTDISEVLGLYGAGDSAREQLNREITKYGFDFRDNDLDLMIDPEKEKERIFSRIVNLITVRSNVFEVTCTGQKVQDVNNNAKIEDKEIMAEKKLKVLYDRQKQRVIYKREL